MLYVLRGPPGAVSPVPQLEPNFHLEIVSRIPIPPKERHLGHFHRPSYAAIQGRSASKNSGRLKNMSIFTILFVILLIAWILGWGVFHVASAMIHLLLIVALISLVLHFVRGPRAV